MRIAPLLITLAAVMVGACADDAGVPATDMANESIAMDKVGDAARQGAPEYAVGGASAPAASRVGAPASLTPAGVPFEEPSAQLPTPSQSIAPAMVIRTGDARIEVDSLEIAIERLHALARQLGGFIGNTSMQSGRRELRQATVELKVPSERFDAAQAGLATLGKVEYVTIQAQDVSEEFVDVTARMENSRRLEERLITLLANRTGKLEEVLAVERELARVRETIERYEGRLRYLRTRAAVSTLSITVHEQEPLVGELGSSNRIVEAFRTAWRNFVFVIAKLIEMVGVLVPLGVVALGVWWVMRRSPRTPPAQQPPVAGE